jgi:hypothetical protein
MVSGRTTKVDGLPSLHGNHNLSVGKKTATKPRSQVRILDVAGPTVVLVKEAPEGSIGPASVADVLGRITEATVVTMIQLAHPVDNKNLHKHFLVRS